MSDELEASDRHRKFTIPQTNEAIFCVILEIRRGINEIRDLLDFWNCKQHGTVVLSRFFGTPSRSHLQSSVSSIDGLKMEPNWLSRKFGTKLPFYAAYSPTRAQVSMQTYYATGKYCRSTFRLKTLKICRQILLIYNSSNKTANLQWH